MQRGRARQHAVAGQSGQRGHSFGKATFRRGPGEPYLVPGTGKLARHGREPPCGPAAAP
jgi:hypothetical protein